MFVRSLLVPVALALAALPAAADDPKPPKPVPAGTVAAKVESVSGTSIVLDDHRTVTVPGAAGHPHLVPGHTTPPHMVGGAHPHMVPGHTTPPHLAGGTNHARPQTKTVDQKFTYDLAADVTVQTTVAGKTGFQPGTTSDVHKGDSVRVTLGTVTATVDGKTTTKTVATKIEVLTEHAAPAAGKKK